ncbi:PAS domain S-box protein [Halorientalis halophila]|uniref:ATP-binding response regulator n=1 Tax=Halorientalis halophila TaxID=3108499 RepID=UPI003008F255
MSDADVDRIRVLHVDDDAEIVDLAATFLRREDERLDVTSAESAADALDRIRDDAVDCVVTDFHLADMDCAEFVAAVGDADPDLPVILFTGRDRARIDAELLDDGISGYLQKGSGTERYETLAEKILDAVGDDVATDGGSDPSQSPDLAALALGDRESVLSTALDTVQDGFFVLDRDRTVVYWNESIPGVTGFAGADLEGMDPTDFFVPDDRERITEAIDEALETGEATIEATVQRRDGGEIPVEFRGSRLTDEAGETVGVAGVARDISDRVAYERELERQTERLEELIGAVSHDLRNPLNVISGRIELAREVEDGAEHFEAVKRSTARMETLIDDLVTLARKGKTVRQTESVDLGPLVEAVWAELETADATLAAETDRRLDADEGRLRRLLEQALENAVVHGGESVSITVGDVADGFYVEDDGPGIPADDRERLLEYGETTEHDASGLGLALIRRIGEAHGWSVAITDGTSGGTRIEITGLQSED